MAAAVTRSLISSPEFICGILRWKSSGSAGSCWDCRWSFFPLRLAIFSISFFGMTAVMYVFFRVMLSICSVRQAGTSKMHMVL